jgi:hypothetical protein
VTEVQHCPTCGNPHAPVITRTDQGVMLGWHYDPTGHLCPAINRIVVPAVERGDDGPDTA